MLEVVTALDAIKVPPLSICILAPVPEIVHVPVVVMTSPFSITNLFPEVKSPATAFVPVPSRFVFQLAAVCGAKLPFE